MLLGRREDYFIGGEDLNPCPFPRKLDIRPDAAQVRILNLLQISVHIQTTGDVNSLASHVISIFGHKKLNNIRYIFTGAITA